MSDECRVRVQGVSSGIFRFVSSYCTLALPQSRWYTFYSTYSFGMSRYVQCSGRWLAREARPNWSFLHSQTPNLNENSTVHHSIDEWDLRSSDSRVCLFTRNFATSPLLDPQSPERHSLEEAREGPSSLDEIEVGCVRRTSIRTLRSTQSQSEATGLSMYIYEGGRCHKGCRLDLGVYVGIRVIAVHYRLQVICKV